MKQITIVTTQGVSIYRVGQKMLGGEAIIERIEIKPLYFTGDPFDHYCGFDKDGNMLFSINCLVPCEVIY